LIGSEVDSDLNLKAVGQSIGGKLGLERGGDYAGWSWTWTVKSQGSKFYWSWAFVMGLGLGLGSGLGLGQPIRSQ
jgi:hypothetical protein